MNTIPMQQEASLRATPGGNGERVVLSAVSAPTTAAAIKAAEQVVVTVDTPAWFREGSAAAAATAPVAVVHVDQYIPSGIPFRIIKTKGAHLAFVAAGAGNGWITPEA